MRIVPSNHSSYPRVGEGAAAQRIRHAYAKRERGEIDDAGYLEVARDYAAEIVREQSAAGCEVVTDGQVHWYDLVSHIAYPLDGCATGGLLRFFDTNYLVRQPEVRDAISGHVGLADDFTHLSGVAGGSGVRPKAVLTGPYTLARHSILTDSAPYADVSALTDAYADVVALETAALVEAGCRLLQVEEPSLLQHPGDARVVKDALARIKQAAGTATVSLVTYFGDAAAMFDTLADMPADMLGFDLVYSPAVADRLVSGFDRPVALGVIDGRNTKLDNIDATARVIGRVADALGAQGVDEIHVQPSCGLEYLPRDRAQRKLERLGQIVAAVNTVGV